MRSTMCLSDVALGLTILVSTVCSVMCLENESGPQDMMSPDHVLPSLNERYLRNYYEMYHDADQPIWKRAPSAGFFGMRGKKVPSSQFYGMRGKKGPSGFLGMRGKKQDPTSQLLANPGVVAPPSDLGTSWTSPLKMKGPALERMDGYDDYSLFGVNGLSALVPYKRAPAEGFMGLRGKRSTMTMGQPASSYK